MATERLVPEANILEVAYNTSKTIFPDTFLFFFCTTKDLSIPSLTSDGNGMRQKWLVRSRYNRAAYPFTNIFHQDLLTNPDSLCIVKIIRYRYKSPHHLRQSLHYFDLYHKIKYILYISSSFIEAPNSISVFVLRELITSETML